MFGTCVGCEVCEGDWEFRLIVKTSFKACQIVHSSKSSGLVLIMISVARRYLCSMAYFVLNYLFICVYEILI